MIAVLIEMGGMTVQVIDIEPYRERKERRELAELRDMNAITDDAKIMRQVSREMNRIPKAPMAHRDKSKYTRKVKHKQQDW
jgi:hypothetical protein